MRRTGGLDSVCIAFARGGVATATKFDLYKVIAKAISACGVLSGTGTWRLHNPADDYPPAPAGGPTNFVSRGRRAARAGQATRVRTAAYSWSGRPDPLVHYWFWPPWPSLSVWWTPRKPSVRSPAFSI